MKRQAIAIKERFRRRIEEEPNINKKETSQ